MDIGDGSGCGTEQRGRPVGLRNTKMSMTIENHQNIFDYNTLINSKPAAI